MWSPINPKNLYLDRAPYTRDEYRENVIEAQIHELQQRGHLRAAARVGRAAQGQEPPAPPPRVGAQTFRPRSRPNARTHPSVIPRPQPWRCPSGIRAD
jgi:hypothetical protein